ncbi:hypothetical protein D3C86_1089980 [compost metagenome]
METYMSRRGEAFDLGALTETEQAFLNQARHLIAQGVAWETFQRFYLDKQSPIWFVGGDPQAGRLENTKVMRSRLYCILQDMAGNLGLEQGYLRERGPSGLSLDACLEEIRLGC